MNRCQGLYIHIRFIDIRYIEFYIFIYNAIHIFHNSNLIPFPTLIYNSYFACGTSAKGPPGVKVIKNILHVSRKLNKWKTCKNIIFQHSFTAFHCTFPIKAPYTFD